MKTLRLPVALCLLAVLASCNTGSKSSDEPTAADSLPDTNVEAQWLFVQTSTAGTFDGEILTLRDVPPTLAFTDRPFRITGHVRTEALVREVSTGPGSFEESPPNAVISILGEAEPITATVVLGKPVLSGNDIAYPITVTEGTIPASFGDSSLFIDFFHHPHHRRHGHFHPHVGAFVVGAAVGSAVARSHQTNTVVVHHTDYVYTGDTSSPAKTPEQKLADLKDMHNKGLISDSDYEHSKQKILEEM